VSGAGARGMGGAPASRPVRYGIAICEEALGSSASVVLQGGVRTAMRRAAGLGYDSVETHIRYPERWEASLLADWAAEAGVVIDAIGTGLEYSLNGLSFTHPDAAVRDATVRQFLRFVDLAAPLGSVVFVGLCRGTAPDRESVPAWLDRFADALVPVADYAGERGVTLGLEPIAAYMTNLLVTTEEALAFTERPGLGGLQLLLDTHHMDRDDPGMTATFARAAGRIAHVHISDGDRRAPGAGGIDFAEVGRALSAVGYDRAVSLEVLPVPSEDAAAEQGIRWMRSVWGE